MIIKTLLIILGSLSIGIGILGIFLPLLPTTPFLLLGAACYIRGSRKLYIWLIQHKWLGAYIINYRENRSISRKTKITSIILLWSSIGYSMVFVISSTLVRLALFIIAIGVTAHLLSLKTLVSKNQIKKMIL